MAPHGGGKKKKSTFGSQKSNGRTFGSLYGANLEQYRRVPVNEDFFPEGSDERLLDDLSHNDGEDSSIVRDVQTASQRVGHVQRLDQVEVRTATAFTGAHAPAFLVTRSSQ